MGNVPLLIWADRSPSEEFNVSPHSYMIEKGLAPEDASSMVGEVEYPYRHHDALYDDIISTHPFKFSPAKQKAQSTNPSIRALLRFNGFFFVGEGLGANNVDTSLSV